MSNLQQVVNRLEDELEMTDSQRVRETGRRIAHLRD